MVSECFQDPDCCPTTARHNRPEPDHHGANPALRPQPTTNGNGSALQHQSQPAAAYCTHNVALIACPRGWSIVRFTFLELELMAAPLCNSMPLFTSLRAASQQLSYFIIKPVHALALQYPPPARNHSCQGRCVQVRQEHRESATNPNMRACMQPAKPAGSIGRRLNRAYAR